MAHAVERGIAVRAASDVQVLQGKGVTGIVDGEPFWLGSHRYVIERGQDSPEASRQAEALEQEGKTVVANGNDRHLCGLLAIADTVRPGAADTLRPLLTTGIEHLVLLTGANQEPAQANPRDLGNDKVNDTPI